MALKKEQTIVKKLIEELRENRFLTKDMLVDLDNVIGNIESISPKSDDYRNRYVLDQKVKTLTEFIRLKLNLREQIERSIKSEFDMRNKLDPDKEDRLLSSAEIIEIAKNIERERTKPEQKGVSNGEEEGN